VLKISLFDIFIEKDRLRVPNALSMHKKPAWYRSDIDGLRAIAILAVVFFHYDFHFFKSGLIGVDVFFVTSGYLIMCSIQRQLSSNTFTLSTFWARRIRRIFPALILVLLCTTLYTFIDNQKFSQFSKYGESVATQSIFISNVHFLNTLNLFPAKSIQTANPSTASVLDDQDNFFIHPTLQNFGPLSMLWSLSVEEQFYILLPILLIVLLRFPARYTFATFSFLFLCSLMFYVYLTEINPGGIFKVPGGNYVFNVNAGYYLLQARAWELLAGVLIALVPQIKFSQRISTLAASLGLFLILLSLTQTTTTYLDIPGYMEVLTVIGTVLVILAHTHNTTFVNRLLSHKYLTSLGIASYSLFLWNIPILTFAKHEFSIESFSHIQAATLLIVAIAISMLSYQYVEKPFLQKKNWSTKNTFRYGFYFMLSILLLGLSIMRLNT
jgi:peptidoglycan/LPS O-acetylase OafA/YrhL